jgi:endoglucanase
VPQRQRAQTVPGDSDGRCGKAPGVDAGKFDPQLAYGLVFGY